MAGCPSGIPADAHACYASSAHCAAVEVESASLALGSKEDAMLIGFALIIVAVFLICALLFRLSIHALPLFVAFLAGSATNRNGSGIVAALAVAAVAAIILLAVAQLAMAHAKSEWTRAAIGLAFAAPAAIAGYHAVHGIAAATMPQSAWQFTVSVLGACIIAAASWTQWSRARL
jgi:hypothetical protein